MANTTFSGPVRSEEDLLQITKNATTGVLLVNIMLKTLTGDTVYNTGGSGKN